EAGTRDVHSLRSDCERGVSPYDCVAYVGRANECHKLSPTGALAARRGRPDGSDRNDEADRFVFGRAAAFQNRRAFRARVLIGFCCFHWSVRHHELPHKSEDARVWYPGGGRGKHWSTSSPCS